MKVLLDTHAFLWVLTDDKRLPGSVRAIVAASQNEILLSVASVWEILVKAHTGRLPLPLPAAAYIQSELRKTSIELMPIFLSHVLRVESLPPHHRDPFDRIILAQAIEEQIPVVSADSKFRLYPVEVLW